MESNNELVKKQIEGFHPNWCALSTVNFQYKRFVTSSSLSTLDLENNKKKHKHLNSNISGIEVKEFYENILKEKFPESPLKKNHNTVKCKGKFLNIKNNLQNGTTTLTNSNFNQNRYFRAASSNDIDSIKLMNIPQSQLNVQDQYGWTALMMAACENATKSFKYLLELGADSTISEKKGLTAISLAEKKGNIDILRIIYEFEKSKNNNKLNNSRNNSSKTPTVKQKYENFFCKICNKEFFETNKFHHETSTLHRFNTKREVNKSSLKFSIPTKNRGFKIMVKQGWNEDKGLGPSGTGNLYPVKTVIRKQRSGLGIEQKNAPKVTHFKPYDLEAVKYRHNYSNRQPSRNDMLREKRRERNYEKKLRTELS